MQGRQAQILWFWATSKMLTPRSRPWRSLKRVSVWARPHKQSHDIGGLMDRSSRELGRHQKRSVSMLWSRAKLRGHCWSTRARSPPATVSLSRRWSLLPCFSPPERSFWQCCHFSSRGLLLLRSELSVTVVVLSFVYECTLLQQRRDNRHSLRLLQGQQEKKGRGTLAGSMDAVPDGGCLSRIKENIPDIARSMATGPHHEILFRNKMHSPDGRGGTGTTSH